MISHFSTSRFDPTSNACGLEPDQAAHLLEMPLCQGHPGRDGPTSELLPGALPTPGRLPILWSEFQDFLSVSTLSSHPNPPGKQDQLLKLFIFTFPFSIHLTSFFSFFFAFFILILFIIILIFLLFLTQPVCCINRLPEKKL